MARERVSLFAQMVEMPEPMQLTGFPPGEPERLIPQEEKNQKREEVWRFDREKVARG